MGGGGGNREGAGVEVEGRRGREGRGGGEGVAGDLLSGLPHYCKVLCVPEWRWSELMSRCWTVAFN